MTLPKRPASSRQCADIWFHHGPADTIIDFDHLDDDRKCLIHTKQPIALHLEPSLLLGHTRGIAGRIVVLSLDPHGGETRIERTTIQLRPDVAEQFIWIRIPVTKRSKKRSLNPEYRHMRTGVLLLACALILRGPTDTVHGQVQREDRVLSSGDIGRRIVEFVERAESVGFSGVVLAATGGQVIAAVGIGSADLAGNVPNTPATLFEIGSATKQFTAAAALRLAEQKKLSLDDSIARHLPGVPDDCQAITLRHLLQHTSGIPGTNSAGGGDDVKKVLPLFLRGGPRHPPGTHWEYWNQGYALLSEIIALGAGEDYTTYCKKALFAPASMVSTRFTGDAAPHGMTVAIGRSARGLPRSALDHPYGSYGFQYRGMGGVVTTVWDLWRWDRALRGDHVLGESSKARLFEPGLNNYGLGWFIRKDPRGKIVQSHAGSVRGFVCELRRYPDEDGCLFVLCNRDDVSVTEVAGALEALLSGSLPSRAEPPRPLDVQLARAIVGKYEEPRGAKLVVESDGKITRAITYWYSPGPVSRSFLGLNPRGETVLYQWKELIKVEIVRNGSEAVTDITFLGRHFRRVR
jgi:CubicO group peptidase (beta-lactamase class C family)